MTKKDRGEKTLEAKPGLTKRKENAHRVRGKLPEGDVGGGGERWGNLRGRRISGRMKNACHGGIYFKWPRGGSLLREN